MTAIPENVYEHWLKVPVIQRKDYTVKFEEHNFGTFIHCDVRNWSTAVAKALARDFQTICELHGGPIHALHDYRDRKHEKFLMLFGFDLLRPYEDHLEIWIWRNNGKPIQK